RAPFIKVFGGTNAFAWHWRVRHPNVGSYVDELLGLEGAYRGWHCAPVNVRLCGAPDTEEVISEDGTTTRVRLGDGTVRVRYRSGDHHFNHIAEYPVKSADDWERVKGSWMDPDDPARFPKDWDNYVDMYGGRDYPLQLTSGGVYGFARNMLGDEALCLSMHDDPGLVEDIMGTYTGMCVRIWKKMAARVDFDLIECWEDMAYKGGSIISEAHFKRFMAPHYRRIREFADEAGIPIVLVDSDGETMALAAWMHAAGANAMYPFEVRAGNDVSAIRGSLPGMGCIGCLDKECMAGGKEGMDAELERARGLIRLGRVIPGPDHFVLENVPFENYAYFMRGLRKVVMETTY
ncbi:MAG: hypothetical protein FWE70_07980, partial [Oscillospiraceae bacterium]|nr:hypothetical protein [Oscillospiraceae bacterium]